jgi:hypothetical protein
MGDCDLEAYRTEAAPNAVRNRSDVRLLLMDPAFPAEAIAQRK